MKKVQKKIVKLPQELTVLQKKSIKKSQELGDKEKEARTLGTEEVQNQFYQTYNGCLLMNLVHIAEVGNNLKSSAGSAL